MTPSKPSAPAAAPADPPSRRRVAKLVLALAAAAARGEFGRREQDAGEWLLAQFIVAAERREARLAARGQVRLFQPGARVYPGLPRLRRRRRRPVAPVDGST